MNEQDNKDQNMSTADLAYGRDRQSGRATEQKAEIENGHSASRDDSTSRETASEPLIPDVSGRRQRWESIQANFVDQPQESVKEADSLVAEVIQELATKFAEEREKLEAQWQGGHEGSTEDLRQALQHYRSFFQRLLAA